MSDRRWALFNLPQECALQLLRGEIRIENLSLPADAEVVGVTYEFVSQSFGIVIHSAAFEPVPEGYRIPMCEGLGWMRFRVLPLPKWTEGENDPRQDG